jgi:Ca-activated chloride channel family protein
MLYFLLAVPVIVLLYLRTQRRRSVLAENFGRFGMTQFSRQRVPGFQRHIPATLFLVGLVVLLIALARPQAQVDLPRVEGTVILVFDVSASMAAKDAEPTRIEAARNAAREFVLSQPETVQIGIVSFSEGGFAVQMPTNDTNDLLTSIERLKPQSGTSLGQGILVALNTIAIDAGLVGEEQLAAEEPQQDDAQDQQRRSPPEADLLEQLPEGPYPSSVIVILSDGENNQSIDPLAAAQAAADHNVRIDALGFGTTAGIILELDGFSVHTALDEAALKQITQVAGGSYYYTQGEQDPQAVYANLRPQLVIKPETIEITALLTAVSILILGLGAVFSMFRFNRLP